MLNCKPQHYIKYWKQSKDESGQDTIEIITHDQKQLVLSGHYVYVWNLIDGFNNVDSIIKNFENIYPENSREEIEPVVLNSLKHMDDHELIIVDWNPFG